MTEANAPADTSTTLTPPAGDATLLNDKGTPADQQPSGAADDKKTDGDAGKDDKGADAPAEYKLAAPEGVELDAEMVSEFTSIAKELKLSPADVQRIADVAIKRAQKQAETTAATVKEWADQCRADKEIGGDNLDANVAIAQKTIDTFGTPELKAILAQSGWGNHPEFVRLAYKVGKAISDDTFVKGGNPGSSNEGKSLAERMYPTQK